MRRHLILFAISFCTALSALAVPVTFQIDLAPRINTAEFDPATDTIEARGSFSDWSGGFTLTNSPANPTIYTGIRDITGEADSVVLFKFVQLRGDEVMWENDPNRAFNLPAEPTTLPVFYYNNFWEGAPIPVKFQVNMGTQKIAGAFNPDEGDTVEVRGGFNSWSGGFTLNPSATDANIYEGTADVASAPGARVEYKFVIVDGLTGSVTWENDPNRGFQQTAEPQDLPLVYFNNVTGIPVKAAVSFAVDMSVYIGAGLLDTNSQEVYIRGNKVGWGNPPEGLQLFADPLRPGIYTNIWKSEGQITGDSIEYKAVIWTPDTQTVTWENGGNKSLAVFGTEPKDTAGYHLITVEPWYFDGVTPGSLLNEDTLVTFRVDMRNARTTGRTPFNPQTDTVALNGAFLPGGWQPWGDLSATQAFDDGASGGDETADDGIYTVQVTLPRGTTSRLVYKYGINGADNEAAIGNDRVRYARATGSYTLPVDLFGTMTVENETQELGPLAINRSPAGEVTITWPAEAGVRLQQLSSLDGGAVTEVPDTDGQGSYAAQTSNAMSFFRLVKP